MTSTLLLPCWLHCGCRALELGSSCCVRGVSRSRSACGSRVGNASGSSMRRVQPAVYVSWGELGRPGLRGVVVVEMAPALGVGTLHMEAAIWFIALRWLLAYTSGGVAGCLLGTVLRCWLRCLLFVRVWPSLLGMVARSVEARSWCFRVLVCVSALRCWSVGGGAWLVFGVWCPARVCLWRQARLGGES